MQTASESNESAVDSQAESAGVPDAADAPIVMLSSADKKRNRKNRGKAMYRFSVDMAQKTKAALNGVSDEQLESTLGAYMQMMTPPTDGEQTTIQVDVGVLQQLALFGTTYLSRYAAERYRS